MTAHRPFADTAGYTRHCWECKHAKVWRKGMFSHADIARCELAEYIVEKYDSPNNPCSHLPSACEYERRAK